MSNGTSPLTTSVEDHSVGTRRAAAVGTTSSVREENSQHCSTQAFCEQIRNSQERELLVRAIDDKIKAFVVVVFVGVVAAAQGTTFSFYQSCFISCSEQVDSIPAW